MCRPWGVFFKAPGTRDPCVKAALFHQHGDLDVLSVEEVPDPEPQEGEVVVDVQACALNRLDLFVRQGWPGLRLPLPHVGGTDIAGTVAAVGPGVRNVGLGEAVVVNPGLNFHADENGQQIVPERPEIVGETRWGGLAKKCLVPANRVLPMPPGLSPEQAACLPLTCQTAMQMLRKAQVREGERVLVVGGGGGVSVMAIQLAKALGAWVCATTGGQEKMERVADLGADLVIDYHADDWPKTAFLATEKQGFDVVMDSVGQATWHHSVRALAPGGRLVTCGATTGGKVEMDVRNVFWKQLTIMGSTMGTPADLKLALDFVAAGKVRPVIDSVWELDDVAKAHERLASGDVFGKVVVTP